MKKIYLNVGGFIILCKIPESEKKYFREKFIEMVNKDYAGFIMNGNKKPDFTIKVTNSYVMHIDVKESNGVKNLYSPLWHIVEKKKLIHVNNPLGPFEFEFLIGYILNLYLLPDKGFILHGSSVRYKKNSFLFMGKERAGKSTTAQLLNGLCNILTDDSMIIRKISNKYYTYQPISNEKNYNFKKSSKAYIPKKIFFIKKADKCYLEQINDKDLILEKMLKQIFTLLNEKVRLQFSIIADFVNKTDFYYLYVKRDEKIFKEFFKKEILKI